MPVGSVIGRQIVRVVGEVLEAVLRDDEEILEAAAAEAGPVEPGLDRDDVSGDERRTRRDAHAGILVHLEPDTVPEAVEEPLLERLAHVFGEQRLVAVRREQLAGRGEERVARRRRRGQTAIASSRACLTSRWYSTSSSGGSPTQYVRVMSA